MIWDNSFAKKMIIKICPNLGSFMTNLLRKSTEDPISTYFNHHLVLEGEETSGHGCNPNTVALTSNFLTQRGRRGRQRRPAHGDDTFSSLAAGSTSDGRMVCECGRFHPEDCNDEYDYGEYDYDEICTQTTCSYIIRLNCNFRCCAMSQSKQKNNGHIFTSFRMSPSPQPKCLTEFGRYILYALFL